MGRNYGCDRLLSKEYSFFRSVVCFPLKGEKCNTEALVTEMLWNIKHWCSSREKWILFVIYCLEQGSAGKSLDFHKPIYCGISLYYIWEKYWSWNQGLRTWEVSHRRIMKLSEKKHRLRKTQHGRMSRSEGYFQNICCRSVGTNSAFAPQWLWALRMWLVPCQSQANTFCYKKSSCCLGVHCELLSVLRRLQNIAMGAVTVSLWCKQSFPVCDLGRWTLMLEGERESRRWRVAKCFENLEKLDKQNISLALRTLLLSWNGIFFLCVKPWCRGLQRNVKCPAAISVAWIRRREVVLKWKWWGLECVSGKKWTSKGYFLPFLIVFWVQAWANLRNLCLFNWTQVVPGRRKGRHFRSLLKPILMVISGVKLPPAQLFSETVSCSHSNVTEYEKRAG